MRGIGGLSVMPDTRQVLSCTIYAQTLQSCAFHSNVTSLDRYNVTRFEVLGLMVR